MLIKVPASALVNHVLPYRNIFLLPQDGLLDVPRWMVPELAALGCERSDGAAESIDARAELEAVPEERHHELSVFLQAHGQRDHYFEHNKHALSDALRERAQKTSGDKQLTDAADQLDSLHQRLYRNKGYPRAMNLEQKKALALKIFDAQNPKG